MFRLLRTVAPLLFVPALVSAQPEPGAPAADAPVAPADATGPAAPEAESAKPTASSTPEATPVVATEMTRPSEKPWYKRYRVRGYAQFRANRLYATEDEFANPLADAAIAEGKGISIRRARLVVSGDVTRFMAIYLQAEFAGADAKMRDWYGDIFLDCDHELRIRVGQSKVPYGWENMQSSSNRLPLDRSDPINSAVPGERDLGAFLYWEPAKIRERFKYLTDSGLKGSGDYGVLALGVYNGQGLNLPDADGEPYVVARATYPMQLGGQILELGTAAYIGRYTVQTDDGVLGGDDVRDMRIEGQLVLYPQPLGFQTEWNIGKGPELVGDTVRAELLHGGYAMLFAKLGDIYPFARAAYYRGGLKTQDNAPRARSRELAVGTEWQYKDAFEVVLEVDHAKRELGPSSVWGTIVRLQIQLNY